MNTEKTIVLILSILILLLTLVSFNYYQEKNKLIAKSKVPVSTACALDADQSRTTPACAIYLTRIKL